VRVQPRDRVIAAGSPTWRERFRLLPRPARLLAFVLFLSALAPGLLEIHATVIDPRGSTLAGALAQRPVVASLVSLAMAIGALLILERPRSLSPRAYARQLRARALEIQADFDGALRRRAHEEEESRHGPSQPPDP